MLSSAIGVKFKFLELCLWVILENTHHPDHCAHEQSTEITFVPKHLISEQVTPRLGDIRQTAVIKRRGQKQQQRHNYDSNQKRRHVFSERTDLDRETRQKKI